MMDKHFDKFKELVALEVELTEDSLMKCIANYNSKNQIYSVFVEDGEIILTVLTREILRLEMSIDSILVVMFNIIMLSFGVSP